MFVESDLPNINKISLGDPRAASLREEREDTMAKNIFKAASEIGGIILDCGGCAHHAKIQENLCRLGVIKEDATFLTVYSESAAEHMTIEERFASFDKDCAKRFSNKHAFGLQVMAATSATGLTEEKIAEIVIAMVLKKSLTIQESVTTVMPAPVAYMCDASIANSFVSNAFGCKPPKDFEFDSFTGTTIKKGLQL